MSEWRTYSVGEIASWQAGFAFPSTLFIQEGVPLVRMSDLKCGHLDLSTSEQVPEVFLSQLHKFVLREGDFLMGMSGSLGNYAKVGLHDLPALLNQRVGRLILKSVDINYEFVAYSLLTDSFKSYVEREAAGAAQKNISSSQIERFQFRCPVNVHEQLKIIEILSTLDEAIEQTEALIAKMQQVKAGLMHDLFTRGVTPDGRLRLTREQAPELYKESSLGWIPREWEVKRLGEILQRCGGYLQTGPFGSQLHAYEYQFEGVPVVMPQDINDGLIGIEQIARIHETRAEELARHRMRIGDIVIARRGELSRAASISGTEQGWVCGTGCFLLRLGQSALRADFAAYVYRQDFVQRQIAGRAVGTTMPSLNNSVMSGLFFPFCDEDEQARIIERLEGVEQNIRSLNKCLFVKRQLKQGLMHDLLTGQILVPIPRAESSVMG